MPSRVLPLQLCLQWLLHHPILATEKDGRLLHVLSSLSPASSLALTLHLVPSLQVSPWIPVPADSLSMFLSPQDPVGCRPVYSQTPPSFSSPVSAHPTALK